MKYKATCPDCGFKVTIRTVPGLAGRITASLFIIAMLVAAFIPMFTQQAEALTVATRTDGPDYTSKGNYSLEDRGGGVWFNSTTVLIAETDTDDVKLTAYNKTSNTITRQENVALINLDNPGDPSAMVVTSTKHDIVMLQSLGGTTQLLNNAGTTFFAESLNAAGAELAGTKVNEVHLWLKKTGAPTGTATIAVFDLSCNTVYSFGTQDSATLTTSFVEMTYRGALDGRTLANGDRIGVFFNGGSAGNSVDVEYSAADRYDGTTNTITHTATGVQGSCTPTAQTAREVHMQLSFNYVNALADDGNTSSFWENAGYTVAATATDSVGTSPAARQRTVNGGNSPAITELLEKKTTISELAGKNVDRIELKLSKTGSPTGTITVAEFNADGTSTNHMNVNAGTAATCIFASTTAEACAEHINAGSALIGDTVNSMTVNFIANVGSPTGTVRMCVMNSTAHCLYEFGNLAASSVLAQSYTFTNYNANYTLSEGEFVGVKGDIQGGGNSVATQVSTTNQFDGTASAASDFVSGSWGADLAGDMGPTGAEQMFRLDNVVSSTIRNTFGTMLAQDLTTTETVYTFTSGTDFTLSNAATTYVGLRYTGGSLADTVNAATIAADTFNGTTDSIFTTLSNVGYTDNTGSELRFRLVDTEVNDKETNAAIYLDFGSAVNQGGIQVYFPDANKIPQKLDLETSTDASVWTVRREAFIPGQAVGAQTIQMYNMPASARYIRLIVDTWGSANSFAVAEYDNYQASLASSPQGNILAEPNPDGTIFGVGCLSGCGASTYVVNRLNIIDWANGNNAWTEASHVVTFVGDGTGSDGIAAFGGATEDFVYLLELDCDCTQLDAWLHRLDYNLTTSSILHNWLAHTAAGANFDEPVHRIWAYNTGGADTIVMEIRYNLNNYKFWKGTTQVGSTVTKDLVWATAYGTADGNVYFLNSEEVAATDRTTYKVNVNTESYTSESLDYSGLPNGDGFSSKAGGVLTFSSDPEKMYLGLQTRAHGIDALNSRGEQVPFYVASKDTGLGQLKQSELRHYYLGDGVFIESSALGGQGTSWTFAKYSGTQADINLFIETLNVALTADDSDDRTWDSQLIFLACDALYTVPTTKVTAASFSDCTQYTIKDVTANPVGREIPFTDPVSLVWAFEFTNYNIHVTTTEQNADDFDAQILYLGTKVDRNSFDAGNNVQLRMLYGQCYNLQFVNQLSGAIAQSTTVCADDVIFKEAILSSTLGFTFWTSTWGALSNWNDTSNILTATVRHLPTPYNYTVQIYNKTNTLILTDVQTNNTQEVDSNNYNLTAFPNDCAIGVTTCHNPFILVILDENGSERHRSYFDTGADFLFGLRDKFKTSGPSVNGWGILLFIPIIFAAMFTRNSAGIGGAMTVTVIGVLVFFGVLDPLVFTPIIIGALFFVAIIGLLAYRILYG